MCWLLGFRCWLLVAVGSLLVACCVWLFVVFCGILCVVGCLVHCSLLLRIALFCTGIGFVCLVYCLCCEFRSCWLLCIARCALFVVRCLLFVMFFCSLLMVVRCVLRVACCMWCGALVRRLLFVACCLECALWYWSLVACCALFVVTCGLACVACWLL